MRAVSTIAAWGLALAAVNAAPPTLDALIPSGARVGEGEVAVTVAGKVDPWPVEAWCSKPGVTFTPQEEKGKFTVGVMAEAEPGPCWVRLFNAEGVSEPRIFVIGKVREMTEDPGTANDGPGEATVVGDLPLTINGRLEKSQDVDAWKVSLKAGETLHARLDGYSLRSGIDPFLHFYDPDGVRIALGNDNPRNLDPRLSHQVEKDGDYVVAVMAIASPPNANVSFHGAAGAAYRLGLALDPAELPSDAEGVVPRGDTLPVEKEGKEAVAAPIDGFGTIRDGEGDRTVFSAAKGQALTVLVTAVDHGFPTDPVLIVEKEDGSLIREVDDTRTDRDAIYDFKVPADGGYAARVEDRFGRAGEEMRYRLEVKETVPEFSVATDKAAYVVEAGNELTIKLTVARAGGHAKGLEAGVLGLPAGISLDPVTLDEKAKDGEIKGKVGAEAKGFSGPIRIRVRETGEGEVREAMARFSYQDSNARGPYLLDEIEVIWLTVKEKPAKPDKQD